MPQAISSKLPRRSAKGLVTSQKVPWGFELVVDYDCPLEDLIDAGDYDVVEDAITDELFKLQTKGKRETVVRLIRPRKPRSIMFSDVKRWLYRGMMRPANIRELITFGNMFPHLFAMDDILAIGSLVDVPNRRYPKWFPALSVLRSDDPVVRPDRNLLSLRCFSQSHSEDCQFLAVPLL